MKTSLYQEYDKFNQIFNNYSNLYHKLAVHFGISDSAMDILYALQWSNSPCTPSEISEFCCGTKQTIHSSLKKMEKDGIVEISPSAKNKKNRVVQLTEKGKQLTEQTIQILINAELNAFSSLSEEERKKLIEIQEKQFSALQAETDKILAKGPNNK